MLGTRAARREPWKTAVSRGLARSEEHTSELQSQSNLVCRLLLEKKKTYPSSPPPPLPTNSPLVSLHTTLCIGSPMRIKTSPFKYCKTLPIAFSLHLLLYSVELLR